MCSVGAWGWGIFMFQLCPAVQFWSRWRLCFDIPWYSIAMATYGNKKRHFSRKFGSGICSCRLLIGKLIADGAWDHVPLHWLDRSWLRPCRPGCKEQISVGQPQVVMTWSGVAKNEDMDPALSFGMTGGFKHCTFNFERHTVRITWNDVAYCYGKPPSRLTKDPCPPVFGSDQLWRATQHFGWVSGRQISQRQHVKHHFWMVHIT